MYQEPTNRKNTKFVRIPLTDEQKALVRNETGKDAEAIELSPRELEERIAPRAMGLDA